jgi:hypothetical protein
MMKLVLAIVMFLAVVGAADGKVRRPSGPTAAQCTQLRNAIAMRGLFAVIVGAHLPPYNLNGAQIDYIRRACHV